MKSVAIQNSKSEYKQTAEKGTANAWEVVKLGDICEKTRSGGTPLTSKKEFYGGKIKFVKIEDLTNARKYLSDTITTITEEGLANSNAWLVPENSVLIGIYGSIGATVINKVKVATNQAILGIIPNNERLNAEFLYYFFLNSKKSFLRHAKHTTQANLTLEIIENLQILLPPLPEQKKIAEILSTVDSAIQKVDSAIGKTERLKRGLMQHLLTRGIGHKKFKDSEIGRISEEWNIVQLKEITLPTESKDPAKEGIKQFKYVDISSVNNSSNKIIGWNLIDGKNAPSRARQLIKAMDVIFATTRPYLKNIAVVPPELDGQICSTGFCVIRSNSDCTLPEWLFYNVLTERFMSRISSKMKGATYPAVSDKDILNEKITLPPLPEQRKISEILGAVDEKLGLERKRKEKLERIKKGLMNDLLTGNKRIAIRGG